MSRKRTRKDGGRLKAWDNLPWKTIEPTLERDDGWQGMGGEEQALLYTLEEISGSDYCLREDTSGNSQMVHAKNSSADEVDPPTTTDAAVTSGVTNGAGGGDRSSSEAKERRGTKRKAAPEEQAAAGAVAAPVAGSAADLTSTGVPGRVGETAPAAAAPGSEDGAPCTAVAQGDGEGAPAVDGNGGATRSKGPKKKKRRGQGKKRRAAEAAARAKAASAEVPLAVKQEAVVATGAGDGARGDRVGVDDPARASGVAAEEQQRAGEQTSEAAATAAAAAGGDAVADTQEHGEAKKPSKRKAKNKNKKKKEKKEGGASEQNEEGWVADRKIKRDWELGAQEAVKMAPWMYLGVELHPALRWHLDRQGFYEPTPIQRRVLPKAILGRKDIIGAAETGSGKTLAFGLPILSEILTRRDAAAAAGAMAAAETENGRGGNGGKAGAEKATGDGLHEGLQALVLCPTRELALQVAAHFREVVRDTGVSVVAVVGGLAEVKQERQLSRRPEVVVATPGRFWEMAGKHSHLSHLETLRHLVVDEADRMLERGHYPELNRLFSMLEKAEGRESEQRDVGGSTSDASAVVEGRGGRGKKNYKLPFDVSKGGEWSVPPEDLEMEDGDDAVDAMNESGGGSESDGEDPVGISRTGSTSTKTMRPKKPAARGFERQTYVFSATLTLGASGRQQRRKGASSVSAAAAKKGRDKDGKTDGKALAAEDDTVTKIMKRIGVRGDPTVIDMGRRTTAAVETGSVEEKVGPVPGGEGAEGAGPPALPSTLKLCSIKSLQMEKDVHAYLFCATYPGRTLIFVNAISIARRLSLLLCALNVPATPLHAQMQQRQRLRSLDRFTSDPKAVLVATDVAARGLDIPKVEHVVHYDAARSAEVFIHRAGRTARARAAGLSLSIVAPRDDANHRQTCSVLGLHDGMQPFPLEMRMVERARERVAMAVRVLKFQEAQNKVAASNDFFRGMSKEADLEMDEDLFMEDAGATPDASAQWRKGVKGLGKKGNQHAARLAAEARQALAESLSRPLHSDRRKLIPVAQTLAEMKAVSERTAAGDLTGKQRARSGKSVMQ